MPHVRLLALALLAALALVAAGCGDDDDTGGSDKPADAQEESSGEQAQQPELPKELQKKPRVAKPTGSPPKELETKDLVKGTGKAVKSGDAITVSTWACRSRAASSSTRPGTRASRSSSRSAPGR